MHRIAHKRAAKLTGIMAANEQKIRLRVAGRVYEMKIAPAKEEIYRLAEKPVNANVGKLHRQHSHRPSEPTLGRGHEGSRRLVAEARQPPQPHIRRSAQRRKTIVPPGASRGPQGVEGGGKELKGPQGVEGAQGVVL